MTRENNPTALHLQHYAWAKSDLDVSVLSPGLTVDQLFTLTARVWGYGHNLRLSTVLYERGSNCRWQYPAHE